MPPVEKWVVFARREYKEPLTCIGTVELARGEDVKAAAKREHGDSWLELVAIPESRIAWAIREE
ncbi:MAG: hypothetical protein U0167_05515 [bacterium]